MLHLFRKKRDNATMHATLLKKIESQIRDEFHAAFLYLNIANWCGVKGFPGFQAWFTDQYREELQHADKLNSYLIDRDQLPRISINAAHITTDEWVEKPLVDLVLLSLEAEKVVSANIEELYAAATKAKDYRSIPIINWFLAEQVEEERKFTDLYDAVNRCNDTALSLLDIEIGKQAHHADVA